ncbi:hypothetical protein NPIL_95351 [Nephila pilipes]|uniref:G2/mitotic-specific cyclin-B3 n=1 Tax=Nephila pilipes TaxID=299642 RepID=A0A8X6TSF8_NEPPI|nr:hypothetical protein NPIL_95351 [Nephila pilipes]
MADLKTPKKRAVLADISNLQGLKTSPKPPGIIFNERNNREMRDSVFYDAFRDDKYPVDSILQNEIYEDMEESENNNRVDLIILKNRKGINMNNRYALVDWLIEQSGLYNFSSDILHRSVYYVDIFLTKKDVLLQEFQTLGASALFLACKFESSSFPTASFISKEITWYAVSAKEILNMEKNILRTLDYNLRYPTSCSFIDLFRSVHTFPLKVYYLSHYLSEIALLDECICAKFLPSEIGAACCMQANILGGNKPIWPTGLKKLTNLDFKDVLKVMKPLMRKFVIINKSRNKEVFFKYSADKYGCVAQLLCPDIEFP